jgi:hypothetical protein
MNDELPEPACSSLLIISSATIQHADCGLLFTVPYSLTTGH